MAIEDPENPGVLLQIEDPVGEPEVVVDRAKSHWYLRFKPVLLRPKRLRETAPAKQ